jgi:hypothetical protein
MNSSPRRIKSPADLLALVPCVLGFHPEDSLVLVVLAGEGGNLHARVDLPLDEEETSEALVRLMIAVSRAQAESVALIAYSSDELLAQEIVDALADRLYDREVDVACAIRADGETWYCLQCTEGCCAAEGVPYDLKAHEITAQAVLDGHVIFRNRQELADSLIGTDTADLEAVGLAADEAMGRFRGASRPAVGATCPDGARQHLIAEGLWVRDRVRRFLGSPEPLAPEEVGRMAVAMVSIEVRDVAWAEIAGSNADRHVELWRDLVRRTPLDLVAAPAALLGFAAWLAGDGALAWCAVERCQQAEPDYSLAGLLTQALAAAIPPSSWQPIPPGDLPLFAG